MISHAGLVVPIPILLLVASIDKVFVSKDSPLMPPERAKLVLFAKVQAASTLNGITWATRATTSTQTRSLYEMTSSFSNITDANRTSLIEWNTADNGLFSTNLTLTGNDLAVTGTLEAGSFPTANSERLCWDASGASLITDCTGSPGDYAEEYGTTDPSIEPGELVVIDPNKLAFEVTVDGEKASKAWVVKSTEPYQQSLLGVVSTNPNEVIGQSFDLEDNPVPITLDGRVPVKVSTENGSITPGDPLTSSSTPGLAMKATKSGPIIGKALESFDETGEGKILVFVSTSWYVGTIGEGSQLAEIDNLSLDSLSANSIILGDNQISLDYNGSLLIDGDLALSGDFSSESISTDKLFLGDESSGNGTISAGKSSISIDNANVNPDSKVIVTFNSDWSPATRFWTEKEYGKFKVRLDKPLLSSATFDWIVIGGK